MALNNLTNQEMVEITEPLLLKGNPARLAIEAQPRTRGLRASLRTGHQALLKVRRPVADPKAASLAKEATETYALLKLKARGVHAMLTGLAIAESPGADYIRLRDQLFESGLKATIQTTFEGQAGYATRVRAMLTPSLRGRLAAIPLPSGNLLDLTIAWLDAGDRLGEIQLERGRCVTPERDGPTSLAARRQWIAAMNVLRAVAQLEPVDSTFDRIVFGPLDHIEEKADQRAPKRTSTRAHRNANPEA